MRAVLAEAMSAATKTDAIIVWDIENNRVPTQLIPCCFEIVQWLLQDVKKNCPHSTVLRVYVAGTFDKYPSQLKNALCTHPRVQLLYSIGKIAKGGEADDALKRVMLDFHTTQLVAKKQALFVLLSGDADYNDVVDAARIAGHKVHLYHSHSVAQTLRGNVDHHEAWHAFLARKSGESVEDLEDTGYLPRGTSPIAAKSSGTPALHRRVPHSHPGVKPIAMHPQLSPIAVTRSIVQDAAWPSSNSPAQLAEHSATSSTAQSEAHSTLQSGPQSKVQSWYDLPEHQRQAASFEQPSKAPQDSGDSDPPLPIRRAPRASRHPPTAPLRQPSASQSPASQAAAAGQLVIMGQSRRHESPSKSVCSRYPPGSANPSSDGRTVVVSGFRKGSAGPQAKQQTLDMCAQFGDVSCCWLRKGRSSCWFSIVQFAEVSSAQAAVQQCCGRSTSSSCLGMRWYLTEAPSAHPSQTLQSQHLKPKCQDSSGASEALLGRSGSKEGHVPQQDAAVLDVSRPHITGRWMPWSTGTLLRVLFGCCLLCVYFVLLGYGF